MTEASRVQKLLIEQNAEIDRLKNRVEKLEAGEIEFDRIIGGYASENARFRDRIEKLEAALAHIYAWYPVSVSDPAQTVKDIREFARKAVGDAP